MGVWIQLTVQTDYFCIYSTVQYRTRLAMIANHLFMFKMFKPFHQQIPVAKFFNGFTSGQPGFSGTAVTTYASPMITYSSRRFSCRYRSSLYIHIKVVYANYGSMLYILHFGCPLYIPCIYLPFPFRPLPI